MADRIVRHKADRGVGWRTVEAPLDLISALQAESAAGEVILVDCLTLWLSNLMHHEHDVEAQTDALCECLRSMSGHVFLVSNEVGLGLVPETPLGRV
jgi:adenosylcobinamide kinase/adenosylcobinamide-phosphate guanylyltransferase